MENSVLRERKHPCLRLESTNSGIIWTEANRQSVVKLVECWRRATRKRRHVNPWEKQLFFTITSSLAHLVNLARRASPPFSVDCIVTLTLRGSLTAVQRFLRIDFTLKVQASFFQASVWIRAAPVLSNVERNTHATSHWALQILIRQFKEGKHGRVLHNWCNILPALYVVNSRRQQQSDL